MASPSAEELLRPSRGRLLERLIEGAIRSSAYVVIGALVLIFVFVAKEAIPLFTSPEVHEEVTPLRMVAPYRSADDPDLAGIDDPWLRLSMRYPWQPVGKEPKYSVWPLLLGTLKVTIVALLIALPIAICAAIFTSEFAPQGVRELIKPAVEILAGIPSVVVGFFALMVLASWVQDAFGLVYRLNAITTGIGLSLAVIPIVYTVAEDALSAVPQAFRDGSSALGANRWQTAWRVVLPAARPGVFAACVLGAGRAVGETMIVLMASGTAANLFPHLDRSFRSVAASIAAELGEAHHGGAHYHVLFFLGALLFVITFFLNYAGQWYVGRLKRKLEGKA